MLGVSRRKILKSLSIELNRAKRFGYYVGVLLVDVAEVIPRGIHKHLPGLTINVHHFKSLLRDYDIVIKTRLRRYTVILPQLAEGESASVVKDRIKFTSWLKDWGPINVGVAIYPINGATSRELLKAAKTDLDVALTSETQEHRDQ